MYIFIAKITKSRCPVDIQGVPKHWTHFVFCHFLGIWSMHRGTFFNRPGNLLHNSHKNFENWFWNSWDNWGQSWHLSLENWHFAITQSKKIILVSQVPTLTSIISAISESIFKFLWLLCSKFPGLLNKDQKFLYTCSRTRENDKKQSGSNIVGHPVYIYQ